jgi:hypothetical protein
MRCYQQESYWITYVRRGMMTFIRICVPPSRSSWVTEHEHEKVRHQETMWRAFISLDLKSTKTPTRLATSPSTLDLPTQGLDKANASWFGVQCILCTLASSKTETTDAVFEIIVIHRWQ